MNASLVDSLKGSSATPASYRIALPPGWRQFTADAAGESALLNLATNRFRRAGRPDVEAVVRRRVTQYMEGLRRSRAVAVYLPGQLDDETPVPMSVVLFRYTADPGSTLETVAAHRSRGSFGVADLPVGAVMRWVEQRQGVEGDKEVGSRTFHYLIPAPGDTRRAMLMSTAVLHLTDEPEADYVSTLELLSDAIAGTFRWT
ncbi:hypothetical protein CLV46_2848 [Diaminobutyricimonas aerilata]|uniref:Uncharacterized protein n=1 Tax=Diaminobutyricimonas aerilata TaxID=1162967 RepID=A0A2M9CN09_9MICO|nr:hypothetical protein [Diaminobutyricimonas aerilata]PJJ73262.1 hypothetical protein CLV46_2848 [Diaminobutyricimonas aerilata]